MNLILAPRWIVDEWFSNLQIHVTHPQDSNANLKVKTIKGVGVRSLAHSISRVRKACQSYGMGTRTNDEWVNYSYGLAQIKPHVV
jgi:hypothetical protein